MADQLGKLRAVIVADASGFAAGLMPAKREIRAFGDDSRAALGALRAGLAGVEAVMQSGLVQSLRDAVGELDEMDELSHRFAVSVEDLSGLAGIAKESGLELAELGAAAGLLNKQLAGGSDALANLGVSAEDLIGRDLATKFGAVGDAINQLGSDEEKLAAANEVFGKKGAMVLELLTQGTDNLREAYERMRASGGIITAEEAARAASAADSLERAELAWQRAKQHAASELAPAAEGAGFVAEHVVGALASVARFNESAILAYLNAVAEWRDDVREGTGMDRMRWIGDHRFENPYSPEEIAAFRRQAAEREQTDGTEPALQANNVFLNTPSAQLLRRIAEATEKTAKTTEF